MDKIPIVSVCMITYGHEKYIEQAIEGVLMQKCDFEIELIVANDSSPDKTHQIISKIIENDSRASLIKYFKHEQNIGMMPNFLFALKQCKGKYIALCDGDDYWTDENKLQKQIDFLDNNSEYIGCFHNVITINESQPKNKPKPWRTYTKDTFELIDTFSKTALFHTCSFVFRKDALQIPDWFKNVKSGDMALYSIIASQGKLKLIAGKMGVYRKNDGGVTAYEKIKQYHKNRVLLWKNINGFYKYKYTEHIDDLIAYHKLEIKKSNRNFFKKIVKVFKA
jgi:glycosyltransferase involved in cell wall biosynthesis